MPKNDVRLSNKGKVLAVHKDAYSSHKPLNNTYIIWDNFFMPVNVLGRGDTRQQAWKDAAEKITIKID